MKRIFRIFILVMVCFLLSSCNLETIDINKIISEPKIKHYPLNGTWALVENIEISGKKIDKKEIQIGERALFKDEHLYLAGKYSRNAGYVLKNIKTVDYFSSKYDKPTLLKSLGTENVKVIDIYDEDKYLTELVKLSDERILIEDEDSFFIYERISDQSTVEEIEDYIDIDKEVFKKERIVKKSNEKVGLLLGIKKEVDRNQWEYETKYIKYDKGNVATYRIDNILLPRKTGFYNVNIKRSKDGKDIIVLSSDKADYKSKVNRTNTKKNILYIGNDYISFERFGKEYNELGIYPLDFIENDENIKMSEILSKDDFNRLQFFTRNRKEKSMDEYNFAVKRKSGYWGLENREIIKEKSEYQWRDYELNIPTPKALVNYDELSIPMWEIKNVIPNIKDAFISPKDNVLVADTGRKLIVYEINNNMKIGKELIKMDKDNDEKIIMAEWSTGEYTDIWEEEVKNYGKNDLQ